MKKKVCYILGAPKLAGAETLTLSILKYINKQEFNTYLILRNAKENLYGEFESVCNNIHFIDMRAALANFVNIFRLRSYLNKKNIDILHVHLVGNFLFSTLAYLFSSVDKLIIHFHNPYNNQKKRFLYYLIIKFSSLIADKIICISPSVMEFNSNKYGIRKSKMVVLENAIDFNRFNYSKREFSKSPILGSIGRLVEQKGYDVLLKSFSIVSKEMPNVILQIIGEGPLKGHLLDLCDNLGISKNVHFLGNIEYSKVPNYLASWDIFSLTSNWEGYGLVLAEASYVGLPIIATSVGHVNSIVEDGKSGLLAEKGNISEISEKMMKLLRDHALALKMGKYGHNLVSDKYSINSYVLKLEKVYTETKNRDSK